MTWQFEHLLADYLSISKEAVVRSGAMEENLLWQTSQPVLQPAPTNWITPRFACSFVASVPEDVVIGPNDSETTGSWEDVLPFL